MSAALKEAGKAASRGEVPVGAVIVHDGAIVASAHNSKESSHDPTAHAEIIALRKAAKRFKNWRLRGSTMYVTLEPCLMCMGAMVQARVERLVFACLDPKAGACGSLYDVSKDERLNHRIQVTGGVMEGEAAGQLREFFSKLREERKRAGTRPERKTNER